MLIDRCRAGLCLAFLGLALAALPAPGAGAAPGTAFGPLSGSAATTALLAGSGAREVTLITGDRVTVTAGQGVTAQAAPRAAGGSIGFQTTSFRGQLWVIPSDAAPLIAAGRLDRRLFDVRYLLANGYGDADSRELPVILEYAQGTSPARVGDRAAALPASTPTDRLESITGAALRVEKRDAEDLWSALQPQRTGSTALAGGLAKVWLDAKVHATLDESVPLVGAPEAWTAGYDGSGVEVAVLDTGIDASHPDVADRIVAAESFVEGASVQDGHGHGTHVASTVAGTGAAAAGRYRGVAPGARLLVGKVLGDDGNGTTTGVIAGMEWAVAQGARVVSMSLGGPPSDGTDALSRSVDRLTASSGALFVIAAGNTGGDETINAPGSASAALTVAATDKQDGLAGFSSRGPRSGDAALKPDIAAPGVEIAAARAAGTAMGPIVDEHYTAVSGTSMATPHVAGAAALLGQRHPEWRAPELKAALMSSATDAGRTVYEQGAGRLDAARAIRQPVSATTANVDFGLVPTSEEPEPIVKQVTYANHSDRPVTLTLSAGLGTTAGAPVPDGSLTVDDTVTVPAGGSATAAVTLARQLPLDRYSGAIVAVDEATGTRLRTPVGLVREPPRVELKVRIRDHAGEPVTALADVVRVDGPGGIARGSLTGEGEATYRVAQGTYSASTVLGWVDGDSRYRFAWLIEPEITVTEDTVVYLDARRAREISFSTPRPAEPLRNTSTMQYQRGLESGDRYASVLFYDPDVGTAWRLMATPAARVRRGALRFASQWTLGRAPVAMEVRGPRGRTLHPLQGIRWTDFDGSERQDVLYDDFVPFTGRRDLPLVDVGRGEAADLAGRDLRGKLALIDSEMCGLYLPRAERLREAGAAGIVAFPSDRGCGIPFRIVPERWTEPRPIGIANVAIPREEGAALREQLERERVTIRVEGTPETPYTYVLKPYEEGRIPSSLHYRLDADDLARTDVEVHQDQPLGVDEYHYLFKQDDDRETLFPTDMAYGPVAYAQTRERPEWVGPVDPEVLHLHGFEAGGPFGDPAAAALATRMAVSFLDRTPSRRRWYVTPSTPGPGAVPSSVLPGLAGPSATHLGVRKFCTVCREGDQLTTAFYMVAGGGGDLQDNELQGSPAEDHTDFDMRLFRNGEEVPPAPLIPRLIPGFELPAEPGSYRLEAQGPQTSVTWRFRSARVTQNATAPGYACVARDFLGRPDPCRPEPIVYVGYDLGSSLRSDNSVRAGRPHRFTVRVSHSPSATPMPRIAGVDVWVSTDGARWKRARLRRTGDGSYVARADYGRVRSGTMVSLRTSAWDAAGNSVEQTTRRAFRLD